MYPHKQLLKKNFEKRKKKINQLTKEIRKKKIKNTKQKKEENRLSS